MSQCLLWWITREAQTWGRSHHIRDIAGTWAVRLTGVAAALRSSNSTSSPLSGCFLVWLFYCYLLATADYLMSISLVAVWLPSLVD